MRPFKKSHCLRWSAMLIIGITAFSYLSDIAMADTDKISAQHFDQFNEFIYRGGEPSHQDLEHLKEMGIRTVIDFRTKEQGSQSEKNIAAALGLAYVNIPWYPEFRHSFHYNYREIADEFLHTLEKCEKPVYVHCQHGRDRTGTMLAIYRMVHDGWSAERSVQEMQRYGFNRYWFWNLVYFIKNYA